MELLNNRYQLHEVLGEGGMGIVYRAHDRLTGRHVALKRVYASVDSLVFNSRSSDLDIRLALAHEFQALASLRHPNIISVLDYGFSADHIPYFTMELLNNSRTLLRAGTHQSTSAKVMLLVQVLRALVYIHRQNILHRDLKPGNVLVVKDPTTQVDVVKVLDFGLSVDAGEARGTLGTLPYMAPEIILSQVQGQGFAYGTEVDLYAVGVLAYQLFVGRYPFHIEDIEMLLHEILDSLPDFSSVDLPPTLQATIARLLAKNPADRYHDANQVIYDLCAAVNLPIIDDDRATRESILQSAKFVGRSGDLQKLEAALELAVSGKGGAWLVGGESGVGKSRLLDELRTRAMVKGVRVLRGQGVESGGLSYQLWRDPLRHLLLSVVPDDLEASVIKPLVPDIADLLNRPIADAHAVNAETQQSRLFSTIIALFRRQTEPTLLLLEDLQWAEESLAALKALLAGCSDTPLLIVASYRHDERPELAHELKNAQIILLDRFNVDGITALTTSMLGDVGRRAEVVRLLERETEGNVFFLIEVMRALAEEAGSLARIGQTTLPDRVLAGGIQSIVRRRLNRVPAWGQPLLKRAAVAGRMLDLRLLDMVVQTGGYLDSKSLNDWLTDCANAAVLEFRDGTWRFTHDKLREALVEQLVSERGSLHREIATHLERLYGDEFSRTAYAETLLDHWRRADEPEKELHYVLLAAPQAIRFSGNYRAAQDWLEHALTLINAGKIAEADHQQMKLLKLLGEACSRLAQYPEAMEHYRQSMALAEKIDDRQMVISNLTGLAEVAIYHTSLPQAQSRAQTALGISREIHDQVGIAKSLQLLGQIDMFRGNLADAKAQFDESLSIFRDLGFEPEVGAQLNYLGTIASIQGDLATAKRYFEQSYAISRRVGDRHRSGVMLHNLAQIAADQADLNDATDKVTESVRIFRELGNRQNLSMALNTVGSLLLRKGDFSRAQDYFRESLAMRRAINDRNGVATSTLNLGISYYLINDYTTAKTLLLESLAFFRSTNNRRWIGQALRDLGQVEIGMGDAQAAIAYLTEAVEVFDSLKDQRGTIFALTSLVTAYCGTEQVLEAYTAFRRGVELACAVSIPLTKVKIVISAADMAVATGHLELAARWTGLALNHPTSIREDFVQIERLLRLLGERLDVEVLTTQQDAGAALDLDAVLLSLRDDQPFTMSEDNSQ